MDKFQRDAVLLAAATWLVGFPLWFTLLAALGVAKFHSGDGLLSSLVASTVLAVAAYFIARQSARYLNRIGWIVTVFALALLGQALFVVLRSR